MKLKELPGSVSTAWKLNRATLDELNDEHRPIIPVIVSLTSIPSRLGGLHLVIRSLLLQTNRPEKIILWLHEDLQNQIPKKLMQLLGDTFEIHYVALTCSHRKLVHSLELFPNKIIVTCDDDLMYDSTWLARLFKDHLDFPLDIIAHECREVSYSADGELRPYKEWINQELPGTTSTWMMPIGYGGVLYPPGVLHPETTRADLYLQLAPRADDLWFKAMSYLQGTTTRRSREPGTKPTPIFGSQKVSLKHTNVRKNGNFEQWQAICNHYHIRNQ